MTSFNNPNTKREIIMKHYSNPQNYGQIANVEPIKFFSKYCVDRFELFIKMVDNHVSEAAFEGQGCAIFLSSTDLMLSLIKNKNIDQIKHIMTNYHNLIYQNEQYNKEILGPLIIFDHVNQLNRLYCAEMIFLALDKWINKIK